MTTYNHDEQQEQFKRNEELVKREVYACVTPMVDYILSVGQHHSALVTNEPAPPFTLDDVENLYIDDETSDGDVTPQEVYEWWAVSPWLYEELKAQGEPVIDTFPHLWGRTTTGQAIALDGVITRIQRGVE